MRLNRSTTYMWEYTAREVASTGLVLRLFVIIVILLLSSCDAALERRKGCANILTDWLQSGSAYAHPSSQASISRRDREGAMGRCARPRAPREQHRRDTRPTIDVRGCKCARKTRGVSPMIQLIQSCGLRPEGDKACARQTPSRTEQQESGGGVKKKKGTTRAVPEWSPTSVLNAPDEV